MSTFAIAVFLACAVEAVEALTIVLALGSARSWKWTLGGAGSALLTLAVLVASLGAVLASLPLAALRIGVGVLLLLLGAQWLRKAVLRASGRRALKDERAAYHTEVEKARGERDTYAFTAAYAGVLLEGCEVVVIVLAYGAAGHGMRPAVLAAGGAILTVVGGGLALRRPLARVPENTLKYAVGVMLTAFGLFWLAEGSVGVSELVLPALILGLAGSSLAATQLLRRRARLEAPGALPR